MENSTAKDYAPHCEAYGCIETDEHTVEVTFIAPIDECGDAVTEELQTRIDGVSDGCTEEMAQGVAAGWFKANIAQVVWHIL